MKTPNDKERDKRFASLLSVVAREAVEPDTQFLTELKAKSTAEFVACNENAAGASGNKMTAISIWRIVMRSRITRIATAAAIVIAAIIVIHQSGGSVGLTTIAIADISEAMKKVPWMRMTVGGISRTIDGPVELLIGFYAKVSASKDSDGNINFLDYSEHKSFRYDSQNRTLTVDYLYEDDFPEHLSSAFALVESVEKMTQQEGVQVVTREGEYKGQNVQLQEIRMEGAEHVAQLCIQPDSKLLLAIQAKVTDPNGTETIAGEMTFEYPRAGPDDIYDLGVPRDARIIDKLPKEGFQRIWDDYRQRRDEATHEYIALITRTYSSFGGAVITVYADYKSGSDHRFENHSAFTLKELNEYDRLWPEYKEQLGDSYESLLAWTGNHFRRTGRISLYLYDGRSTVSTERDDEGSWSQVRVSRSRNKVMPSNYLARLGWPNLYKTAHIIEDDYAKENDLICVERLQQGSIYKDNISLPGRFVYYLDPQKDYICRRQICEWRPDAEWQRDKNWLDGVEPDKITNGSITVYDTTEIIQAPNGHWYPRVIVEKQSGIRPDYREAPLEVTNVKTIYLRTSPEFPSGIFDQEGLPGR